MQSHSISVHWKFLHFIHFNTQIDFFSFISFFRFGLYFQRKFIAFTLFIPLIFKLFHLFQLFFSAFLICFEIKFYCKRFVGVSAHVYMDSLQRLCCVLHAYLRSSWRFWAWSLLEVSFRWNTSTYTALFDWLTFLFEFGLFRCKATHCRKREKNGKRNKIIWAKNK